jgi:hypothetical protein
MDEMTGFHEVDAAMREVVERRDKALRTVPRLSLTRRRALTACLARLFPVETTLRELVARRDQALDQSPVRISAAAESILQGQLAAAEPTAGASRTAFWLNLLRSPLAAALTFCFLVAVGILGLGRWETSRANARSVSPGPLGETIRLESGMEPFVRTIAIGPFNLSTNEPASLQASFFADRRIRFSDGKDTALGLRLDLPATAASMEDGFAGTP